MGDQYKPQYGVDYFTDAEKGAFLEEIDEHIVENKEALFLAETREYVAENTVNAEYVEEYVGEYVRENTVNAEYVESYVGANAVNADQVANYVRENAAPAGYGLGAWTGHMGLTDADAMHNNGWYYCNNVANTPFNYGWMFVIARDSNWVKQEFYSGLHDTAPTLVRFKQAGYWGEWEWVNPPLLMGVEYRTTERHNGKPVYAYALSLGALPNATTKDVSHSIANIRQVISCTGTASDGRTLPFYGPYTKIHIGATRTVVSICTETDESSMTGTATIKYTKSTD